MDDQTTVEVDHNRPLLLKVRFAPSDLPPGAVDGKDLALFLEGMQQTLDGMLRFDSQIARLDEAGVQHHRFVVVGYRRSSVEILVMLALLLRFLGGDKLLERLRDFGSELVASAIRKYVEEAAAEIGRTHGEAIAKATLDSVTRHTRDFSDLLHHATSTEPNGNRQLLPPELIHESADGLRKMAHVGAKPSYQAEGIQVSNDVQTNRTTVFDARSEKRLDSLLKEIGSAKSPVVLVGTIEEPSRFKKSFLLVNPQNPSRSGRIRCYYDAQLEDWIRALYANRAHIQVTGIRHQIADASGSKPRTYVEVSDIQIARPSTLWESPN